MPAKQRLLVAWKSIHEISFLTDQLRASTYFHRPIFIDFLHIGVQSGTPRESLAALAALDREINRFCHTSTNSVHVCSWRQPVEPYFLLIGDGDKIAVCVKQLEYDLLIAVILIDLRVQK